MLLDRDAFERRFGGTRRLLGARADAVFQGEAWIIGIGGVGSWVAEGLARMGVARLRLFDMDHVAESNLNRQLHAVEPTLGMSKVQAMRERIHSYHPDCDVQTVDDFVTPENWSQWGSLVPSKCVVIDACDQLRTKVALASWSLATQSALICVGAAGGKRRPQDVEQADLSLVTHDPLLAKLRYEVRRHHGASRTHRIGLQCVFSRETVMMASDACGLPEQTDSSLNCHGYGSLATVTGTFGLVAAAAAMQILEQKVTV